MSSSSSNSEAPGSESSVDSSNSSNSSDSESNSASSDSDSSDTTKKKRPITKVPATKVAAKKKASQPPVVPVVVKNVPAPVFFPLFVNLKGEKNKRLTMYLLLRRSGVSITLSYLIYLPLYSGTSLPLTYFALVLLVRVTYHPYES
jgi:hypothetical protein